MTIHKLSDWPSRLLEAIEARRNTPFAYGSHDCGCAAGALISAQVGEQVEKRFLGYRTLRGARNRLRKNGGLAGFISTIADDYGWSEVPPAFAQRGDCVLVRGDKIDPDTGLSEALGIVDLDGMSVLLPEVSGGWTRVPLSKAIRVWRVG